MRKLFTLTGALLMASFSTVSAQTNLDFESWSGSNPTGWATSNAQTQAGGGAQTVFRVTTNPAEGSSSVRLVTGSCPTCPDFAVFGPFGPPTPLPNPLGGSIQLGSFDSPGISYSQRPLSLDFRYKANPATNDACGLQIELTRYNAATDEDETVGEGFFEVSADVANWTSVNVPIVYYTNQTPDKLNIWAVSSIGSIPDLSAFGFPDLPLPTPVAGSEFFIDALVLNLPSCNTFSINTSGTGESSLGAGNGTATVNVSGGAAPYTYEWSNLGTTSTITGLIPGYYFVTVTDANGCQKTASYYVRPGGCSLSVSATGTNSTTNSIYTGNGSATVSVSGNDGPVSYQWNTGATTATLNNLPIGTYAVLVTEDNDLFCAAWAYFTVYGPNGAPTQIEESEINAAVVAFPNPADEQITLRSDRRILQVDVFNITGQRVMSRGFNAQQVDLNLNDFPSGVYLYQVRTEEGNTEGRFVRN